LVREDSIHIKIKLDIDEEDKQIITNVSEDLAKADVDEGIKKTKSTRTRDKDEEEKQKDTKDEKESAIIKAWKEGNVGKINQLSSAHFANLRRAATNPGQYLLGAFTKKLGKVGGALARGGLVGIIALIVYETVLFVLDQLMMPGRWLDRRFKRIARLETMNFYERTLQEEIRHGYQEIRVTTMQGLRGGASQVNGNLFEFSSGATGIIQSSPYRSSQSIYQSQNASGNVTDTRGNPRRRNAFFDGR
jgi:hypothetical protein